MILCDQIAVGKTTEADVLVTDVVHPHPGNKRFVFEQSFMDRRIHDESLEIFRKRCRCSGVGITTFRCYFDFPWEVNREIEIAISSSSVVVLLPL